MADTCLRFGNFQLTMMWPLSASLDPTLTVCSMVITVVTRENNKSSIQYIGGPKRWPVERSAVADSCPDVKNDGKDGFQQAFIDDFHLYNSRSRREDRGPRCLMPVLLNEHSQGRRRGSGRQRVGRITSETMFCSCVPYHLASCQKHKGFLLPEISHFSVHLFHSLGFFFF